MNRPPRSLQARLLTLVLAVVVALWLAAAAFTWFDTRHELDELLDGHLAQAAALLVAQQAHGIEGDEVDAPSLHRYAPTVMFQVFHEGRLALRSNNAPLAPMVAPGAAPASGFSTIAIDGNSWRVFAARGAERDIVVYVGEQTASRSAILWAVLRGALWPMAAALPLLALAAWWAIHIGVAPMRRLGRAIGQRQPQATEPIDSAGITSEMVPMVDALNRLFARTGALIESERRFTADAAHELRTPIAAIRAQAQVARAEAEPDLRRHALEATIAGCDRATRVVEQLLTLSRLEGGEAPDMRVLDLSALAQNVVGEMAAKALGKGQTLAFDGAAHCQVLANDTLLMILVRNLVDNAIRYCPNASAINVRVQRNGGAVCLTVEDDGPGLEADALARLGERFFRLPGNAASGTGLGWSIVRRIAEVHGVDIALSTAPGSGGLSVRLTGPAAPHLPAP